MCSYRRGDLAKRCRRNGIASAPVRQRARVVNGTEVTLDGEIIVTAKVNHRTLRQAYLILPTLTQAIILGRHTQLKLGIQVSIGNRPLTTDAAVVEPVPLLSGCNVAQQERLRQLLAIELPKFETIQGPTRMARHRIRLKTTRPINQRYTPRNPAMQQIINEEVDKMLADGIIEPSQSRYEKKMGNGVSASISAA